MFLSEVASRCAQDKGRGMHIATTYSSSTTPSKYTSGAQNPLTRIG